MHGGGAPPPLCLERVATRCGSLAAEATRVGSRSSTQGTGCSPTRQGRTGSLRTGGSLQSQVLARGETTRGTSWTTEFPLSRRLCEREEAHRAPWDVFGAWVVRPVKGVGEPIARGRGGLSEDLKLGHDLPTNGADAMADPKKTLVIFAQSRRVIDQIYQGLDPRLTEPEGGGYLPPFSPTPHGPRGMRSGEVTEYTESHEMPDAEHECIMRAWRIGHENGYAVRLIDVAEGPEFREWILRHKHDLKEFPVLLLPDGRRLDGPAGFTEERLRSALKP